jgi:hypothetical protein
MVYYVYSVYYKHGEYKFESFDTEKELRDHLIEECLDIIEDLPEFYHINEKYLTNMHTSALVCQAQVLGKYVLDTQGGYGIVSVVKGEQL